MTAALCSATVTIKKDRGPKDREHSPHVDSSNSMFEANSVHRNGDLVETPVQLTRASGRDSRRTSVFFFALGAPMLERAGTR